MRVAILAPFNLLRQYSALSTYHLTLLHLYKNKEYREFYVERAQAGDFVILDNGANEGVEVDNQTLYEAAREYSVSEVVAPDQPRDGVESTERTLAFLAQYNSRLVQHNISVMGVPHGDTLTTWVTNAQIIGPHAFVLGVSKKVEEFTHRYNLMPLVNHPRVHLLGADSKYEDINRLSRCWNVRGVDTQKLVAAGLAGVQIDPDTTKAEVPSVDLGLRARIDGPQQHNKIIYNINTYRYWAGDHFNSAPWSPPDVGT